MVDNDFQLIGRCNKARSWKDTAPIILMATKSDLRDDSSIVARLEVIFVFSLSPKRESHEPSL